jgi:hypothetical protein
MQEKPAATNQLLDVAHQLTPEVQGAQVFGLLDPNSS